MLSLSSKTPKPKPYQSNETELQEHVFDLVKPDKTFRQHRLNMKM